MGYFDSPERLEPGDIALYDGPVNRPPSGFRWPGLLGRDVGNDLLETWNDGAWARLIQPMTASVGRYTPTGGDLRTGQVRQGYWAAMPGGICAVWGVIDLSGTGGVTTGTGTFSLPFNIINKDLAATGSVYNVRHAFGTALVGSTYAPGTCLPVLTTNPSRSFTIQASAGATPTMATWFIEYEADYTSPDPTTTVYRG